MTSSPEDICLQGLDEKKVPGLPPAAYYIRDFITEAEEDRLLQQVSTTPQPKWKTVGSGRRLQYWGMLLEVRRKLTTGGTLGKNGVLLPEPMPAWARGIAERIDSFLADAGAGIKTNQVLVNEYASGQGISPHEDGPAFAPLVCTLSLGSPTVLDLHHYVSPESPSPPMIAVEGGEGGGRAVAAVPLGHVLLERRSLFVLTGSLYASHLHGIAAKDEDWVKAPSASHPSLTSKEESDVTEKSHGDTAGETRPGQPDIVANASLLEPATEQKCEGEDGYRYKRETRVSLTFRHANKVLKGGKFSILNGGLRRT